VNDKRAQFRAAVFAACEQLERRADIALVPSGEGVTVMGHLKGKPRTIANFRTIAIAVLEPDPSLLIKWVREIKRERFQQ